MSQHPRRPRLDELPINIVHTAQYDFFLKYPFGSLKPKGLYLSL